MENDYIKINAGELKYYPGESAGDGIYQGAVSLATVAGALRLEVNPRAGEGPNSPEFILFMKDAAGQKRDFGIGRLKIAKGTGKEYLMLMIARDDMPRPLFLTAHLNERPDQDGRQVWGLLYSRGVAPKKSEDDVEGGEQGAGMLRPGKPDFDDEIPH